jgi:hypothetical protein
VFDTLVISCGLSAASSTLVLNVVRFLGSGLMRVVVGSLTTSSSRTFISVNNDSSFVGEVIKSIRIVISELRQHLFMLVHSPSLSLVEVVVFSRTLVKLILLQSLENVQVWLLHVTHFLQRLVKFALVKRLHLILVLVLVAITHLHILWLFVSYLASRLGILQNFNVLFVSVLPY